MGHCLTGADTSARGVFVESDYNRKIGKLVIEKLQKKGHTIVNCTIDGGCSNLYDSLAKRVAIANNNNVDLYCSVHFNAFNGTAHGTETWLANRSAFSSADTYNKNYAIAKRVQEKVVGSCGFYDRGVKNEDFYVIYNTKALAVLIEICFCDNQGDANKLNIEKVATAICEGLTNEDYTEVTAPVPQPSNEVYRVRKSWEDRASQVGAYKVLDNAKKECDDRSGYSVFNSNGIKVHPTVVVESPKPVTPPPIHKPPVSSGSDEVRRYAEDGIFYFNTAVTVRTAPVEEARTNVVYYAGENVRYHTVILGKKFNWVAYARNNGTTGYLKVKDLATGESYGYAK